jgi:hypothetical protein
MSHAVKDGLEYSWQASLLRSWGSAHFREMSVENSPYSDQITRQNRSMIRVAFIESVGRAGQ